MFERSPVSIILPHKSPKNMKKCDALEAIRTICKLKHYTLTLGPGK